MTNNAFEEFANDYDQWFLSNPNVLKSELALLAHCLTGR